MNAVQTTVVKRADALAVGDIINGGNAPKGHEVLHVSSPAVDDMLGMVVYVTVRQIAQDVENQEFYLPVDYMFRPSDRLHVQV